MAEPLDLAEVWVNERTVSMSVSPTNAETIKPPDRAAVRNSPRNTGRVARPESSKGVEIHQGPRPSQSAWACHPTAVQNTVSSQASRFGIIHVMYLR